MPKGLKPVRRKLATGEVRVYWYHRASGLRLEHDPRTAAGLLEIAALDDRAKALESAQKAATGSLAHLWTAYTGSPEWAALKPRTRSDYKAVRDWIGAAAESAQVRRIDTAKVVALRDKAFKAKGRRFSTYVVQVLRMLFGWGKLRGWIAENPATGVPALRRPTGARVVNRAWTPAEVAAFAEAAPPQLLVPFALGLFAGLRQGDALIITWKAYDGAFLRWIAGKNGEDCIAPVTGPLRTVLEEARERRGRTLQIAVTSTGTAWTASGFRASFFKLVRSLTAAGKLAPGCTFHGLRHTIASSARNDGESDSRVAAAIGDRSPAMAQIYGRNADRHGAQAAILEAAQKRFANIDWKQQPRPISGKRKNA
ncbi:tyrosine-type recombinase/integrase [Phenylobacterium sp.]|uniref:tyrosine-type recombinase/integrase n=1 Tax=Phenylobacterium sp. TaxID=1871053 RepID=UPI002730D217|nr:tyrosine-type recombinase/integrase [Phenylobacterium sp.]MDP1873705.1 tyrosine-type recombinase/integrase [Phenylobacterium sp.]